MRSLFKKLRRQGSIVPAIVYLSRALLRNGPRTIARRWNRGTVGSGGVAVCVRGGVGDHIVAARFLRDLRSSTEAFPFDVFSPTPGIAKWIFAVLPGFRNCAYDVAFEPALKKYDLALEISSIVTVAAHSTGSAGPKLARSIGKICAYSSEMKAFIDNPVRLDGFVAQKLQFGNATRASALQKIAGIFYGGDRFPLAVDAACLGRFALDKQTYVTVHNGFEAQYTISAGRATKCYPHFGEAVALLKRQFPAVQFVQIGAATSIPIAEVDRNLLGKTSLPEAAAILAGALAHLDNESGLVHMASCFGVPSCVIFGPTPADYFGYSQNVNLRPKICGGCWWITEDWMERCPRGFAEPVCTFSQTPRDVAQAMGGLIESRLPTHVVCRTDFTPYKHSAV